MQRDDFDANKPVSRGQWRAIACAALALSGEPIPASRLDATELLVRLRRTVTTDRPANAAAGERR